MARGVSYIPYQTIPYLSLSPLLGTCSACQLQQACRCCLRWTPVDRSKVVLNICWWFCWYKWRSPLHTCGRLCFSLFDLVQPCSTLFNPVRPCTSLFDLVRRRTMSDAVELSRSNLWLFPQVVPILKSNWVIGHQKKY